MPSYLQQGGALRIAGTPAVRGIGTFGEALSAELTATEQVAFTYGLLNEKVYQFTLLGGTLSVTDNKLQATCGGSIGSTAFLRTQGYSPYRPGQGFVHRFTAIFDVANATTGVSQVAGAFGGSESGLFFGYDYTTNNFGVSHQYGGVRELQTLTVTTGAGGNETATVTLNGVGFDVALTSANTTATAEQLALGTYTLWEAYALGPVVYYLSGNVGDKTGAFSVSSTGTTTGTFAEVTAGVAATNVWTPQAAWNRNTLTGEDFTLDPAKGNVYQIHGAYLGFSGIDYSVMHPGTGEMVLVHRVEHPNNATTVNLSNPNMAPGCAVSCLTSTDSVTMQMGSMASFIEGGSSPTTYVPRATSASGTSSGSAPALSIRNAVAFANRANFRNIYPTKLIVSATTGNKPLKVDIVRDAVLTGAAWTELETDQSLAHYDTTATAATGGITVGAVTVSPGSTIVLDVTDIITHRGESLTVVLEPTGTNIDYVVAIDWREDL